MPIGPKPRFNTEIDAIEIDAPAQDGPEQDGPRQAGPGQVGPGVLRESLHTPDPLIDAEFNGPAPPRVLSSAAYVVADAPAATDGSEPAPDSRSILFIVPQALVDVVSVPEPVVARACAIQGTAFAVGASLLIFAAAPRQSMLWAMFDFRSPAAAIPVAILAMFLWSMLLYRRRLARVRALEALADKRMVHEAVLGLRKWGSDGPRRLLEQLNGVAFAASPVLRRIHGVVEQWRHRPGLQDADIVLQQHVANDEEAVSAGYGMLRTFIWAMPVLGLIGTVIGISLAVGGFARFLAGGVDDVSVIKQSLVGVTTGLSFAFLITLEGLLAALLVMLPVSALQAREERLYAAAQHLITDTFLPALQEAAPAADTLSSGPLVYSGGMPGASPQAWEVQTERFLEAWREQVGEYTAAALQEVSRATADANAASAARIELIAQAVGQGQGEWLLRAERVATAVVQENARAHAATRQSVESLAASLREMQEQTERLCALQERLHADTLRLEREGDLTRALSGVGEALSDLHPFLARLSGDLVVTLAPARRSADS